MTEEIADMLLTQVAVDKSETIDSREFTDALRMGQIEYVQQQGAGPGEASKQQQQKQGSPARRPAS